VIEHIDLPASHPILAERHRSAHCFKFEQMADDNPASRPQQAA
jgi:hypothetical protein